MAADLLSGLGALLGTGMFAFCGLCFAHLLAPRAGLAIWLAGGCVSAMWIAAALFHLLAAGGFFNAPCAFAALGTLSLALWTRIRRDAPFAERLQLLLARLRGVPAEMRRHPAVGALALACAAAVALRAARSLVAPPMGHDALMYHLYKAGRFVATGGFVSENAPDAWSYFEWFPYLGSAFHAWSMLPFHGDHLVGIGSLLFWCAGLAGAYATARQWGSDRAPALLVALALGFVPACIGTSTAGYVDHMSWALCTLGLGLLSAAWRTPTAGLSTLAVAAFALAVGIKITAAPALLMACAVVWYLILRGLVAEGTRLAAILGCTLAILAVAPIYVNTWVHRGSPAYPHALAVGGREVFAGNDQLERVLRGETSVRANPMAPARIAAYLFWKRSNNTGWPPNCNLGPASPFLMVAGLAGAALLLRRRETAVPALFALLVASAMIVSFMSDDFRSQRSSFVNTVGRLVLPGAACLILPMAALPRRTVMWLAGLAVVAELPFTTARGIGPTDWSAIAELAFPTAVAGIVGAFAFALLRGHGKARQSAWIVPMCFLAAILDFSAGIAQRHRHAIWAAAARQPAESYDFHPVAGSRPSPVWQALDRPEPLRIAMIAGWDGIGHNWLRYPMSGSRLQNTVVYVPVTEDGSIIDYEQDDRLRKAASFEAWHRRLLDRKIDIVAPLRPFTIELEWIFEHPQHFVPIELRGDDRIIVFAVRKPAG